MAAVSLGLEERIHKMNVIALDLLDSLISNAIPFITSSMYPAYISAYRLEELGIIDLIFAKAVAATDRLLNRILDTLPKIGDIPGVGIEYLILKTVKNLHTANRMGCL